MRTNYLTNVLEAMSQSTMEREKNERRKSLARKESLRSQAESVGLIDMDYGLISMLNVLASNY